MGNSPFAGRENTKIEREVSDYAFDESERVRLAIHR